MDATVFILGACLVAMVLANLVTTFKVLAVLGDMSLKVLASENHDAAALVSDHAVRMKAPQRVKRAPAAEPEPSADMAGLPFQEWSAEFARDINTPFEGGNGTHR